MGVTILGSINVDVILQVAALPRAGETVLAETAARLPGGKGANQAVAAARMGASAALIGAVGADEAGAWMREELERFGVDLSALIVAEGVPTGAAYIAVDAAAENQIVVAPGANRALTPGRLPLAGAGGVLLAQLEIPIETVAAALAPGRLRLLNAAPALPGAAGLFGQVDVLIVNQHELAFYLGVDAIGDASAALAARALITRDDQVVIVTLGADGALAVWRDRAFHAPPVPVTPVDTVGAGDCFCGALAALLDEGWTIDAALPLANAAAALCTQSPGAAPAMPDRAAAEAFLRDRPTEYARAIKNLQAPVVE